MYGDLTICKSSVLDAVTSVKLVAIAGGTLFSCSYHFHDNNELTKIRQLLRLSVRVVHTYTEYTCSWRIICAHKWSNRRQRGFSPHPLF